MTRGAVSKVLDKLEGKALISRAENPQDNRVQWLSLTPSGQRLVPKLDALADRNDQHFFGSRPLTSGRRSGGFSRN